MKETSLEHKFAHKGATEDAKLRLYTLLAVQHSLEPTRHHPIHTNTHTNKAHHAVNAGGLAAHPHPVSNRYISSSTFSMVGTSPHPKPAMLGCTTCKSFVGTDYAVMQSLDPPLPTWRSRLTTVIHCAFLDQTRTGCGGGHSMLTLHAPNTPQVRG